MEFGERLKHLMDEKGVTVSQLSKQTSISKGAIKSYLNEKSKPRMLTLFHLWDFFDVSLDYLMCRTDIKEYKHVKQKPHI